MPHAGAARGPTERDRGGAEAGAAPKPGLPHGATPTGPKRFRVASNQGRRHGARHRRVGMEGSPAGSPAPPRSAHSRRSPAPCPEPRPRTTLLFTARNSITPRNHWHVALRYEEPWEGGRCGRTLRLPQLPAHHRASLRRPRDSGFSHPLVAARTTPLQRTAPLARSRGPAPSRAHSNSPTAAERPHVPRSRAPARTPGRTRSTGTGAATGSGTATGVTARRTSPRGAWTACG